MSGGALDYAYSRIETVLDEWPEIDLSRASEQDAATIGGEVEALRKDAEMLARRLHDFEWWLSCDYGDETYAKLIREKQDERA